MFIVFGSVLGLIIGVIRLFATIHPKQSLVAIDSWELLGFLGWFLCQLADFRGVCVILTVHEVPWWNRWPVLLHIADAKTFHQRSRLMAKSSRSKNIKFSRAMLRCSSAIPGISERHF